MQLLKNQLNNTNIELQMLNFEEARKRLEKVLKPTKLIYSPVFSKESGMEVYIKPENIQNTGSFKIRGAYNKICKLPPSQRRKGLICSSAGNHAQGVAFAAQRLGAKATIVMPKTTPLIKVEATKNYGAKVVLAGDCYDEAYGKARGLQKEHDYVFIHAFDDLDVIEGQGTIALEIFEELHDVDYILVPVGGGGLISGIALAAKALNPRIKIIGLEPEGASSMKKSVENNRLLDLKKVSTIADGVAVKKPGAITYSIIKDYVDDIITVTDFEIMEAFLLLLEKHKMIGENAGVLSLAGVKKLKGNKKAVCLVSGGNIDVLTISSMINQGLYSRGRILCFSVDLPDQPGELMKISQILADLNANVIKLAHNQFKAINRLTEVQLEVTVETNNYDHIQRIISKLHNSGFKVKKVF
jgi:threonine dehydratase